VVLHVFRFVHRRLGDPDRRRDQRPARPLARRPTSESGSENADELGCALAFEGSPIALVARAMAR
jgi:hypothetical protein